MDAAQTPVLITASSTAGQLVGASKPERPFFPARVAPTASSFSRRGYRLGELDEEINARGNPFGIRARTPSSRGLGVAGRKRRDQLAAASFSPDTGLFYVGTRQGYSIMYLTDTDPSAGLARAERGVGTVRQRAEGRSITRRARSWSHPLTMTATGNQGVRWVCSGTRADCCSATTRRQLRRYRPRRRASPVWHGASVRNTSNGPQTTFARRPPDGRRRAGTRCTRSRFSREPRGASLARA